MTAGSRIVIALVVLAFLGTGLYYLAISDEEGGTPAIVPAVSEPTPAPARTVEDIVSAPRPVAEQTLAFRVPVSPSDPIDRANALKQLQVPGWRNVPGAPIGWYPLERLDAFYSTEDQKQELLRDPSTYLRERFTLIAAPSEGKLFVLLYGTSGKSLAPARRRGVDVMSVSMVPGESSQSGLSLELGSNTYEMLRTLQARNISRKWAVLVDGTVIDVAPIGPLEGPSIVICDGCDSFTDARLASIKSGILGTSKMMAARFDSPAALVSPEPERELLLAASTTVAQDTKPTETRRQTAEPVRPVTPATPTNAGTGMTDYVVQEGDTLADISENWFGLRGKWALVVAANPGLDPSRLSIGQVLMLPPKSAAVRPVRTEKSRASSKGTYVIEPGDSLSQISYELYGAAVHWDLIYKANEQLIGKDPAALVVGQVLVIPPAPTD